MVGILHPGLVSGNKKAAALIRQTVYISTSKYYGRWQIGWCLGPCLLHHGAEVPLRSCRGVGTLDTLVTLKNKNGTELAQITQRKSPLTVC